MAKSIFSVDGDESPSFLEQGQVPQPSLVMVEFLATYSAFFDAGGDGAMIVSLAVSLKQRN